MAATSQVIASPLIYLFNISKATDIILNMPPCESVIDNNLEKLMTDVGLLLS